jgi:protocatechuate 3,4-dioxygenase beta subunit
MIRRAVLATCLVLFLAACSADDQSPRPELETVFSGTLVFIENESPLPDLEVTLFEPDAQVVVGRDVSDADGYFEFAGIPEGAYVPVVRANGFRPVFLTQPRWPISSGEQIHVEIRMRAGASISPSGYSLRGRVVDITTGEPIQNARVEMNFGAAGELNEVNWSEYAGWQTTLEAASDEDGMFFIEPCPVIKFPNSPLTFIPGYRVTAPGYKARRMDRNYEPATVSSIFQGVRLTPGEDEGAIEGTVLDRDGQPLADVPVSVEWRRVADTYREFAPVLDFRDPDSVMIPGGVTTSDEDGFYRIGNLPQGYYNVQAGIYPDDGWAGTRTGGVSIEGFSATATADLLAFPVVRITYPPEAATLDGGPERFEWEAYEGAGRYQLRVRRDHDDNILLIGIGENFAEFDPGFGFFNRDGFYAWEVLAADSEGQNIGITDRPHVFRIARDLD